MTYHFSKVSKNIVTQCSLNFKSNVMCNKETKIVMELIEQSDIVALSAIQKKINQWITIGKLVKYDVHTTNESIMFNICLHK